MSHFAELDENNTVLRVTVGDNNDPNGDEGLKWLQDNLGGNWVQTSYNANFRGKYAGIGDLYLLEFDRFVSAKCHEEANINETTFDWDCGNEEHNVDLS